VIFGRKDGAELVNKLVREGRISSDVVYEISKVMLSKEFGWLPEQIENIKPRDREIYNIVLNEMKRGANR
jgi:hypothetical protein